jgi:hypothetical protein
MTLPLPIRLTLYPDDRQVAPSRVRGALGSINQLVICIGIVAALVANVTVPAARWRSLFLLATAPAAALGLGAPGVQRNPSSLGSAADAVCGDGRTGRVLGMMWAPQAAALRSRCEQPLTWRPDTQRGCRRVSG